MGLPELPTATYKIFVRGGLGDSPGITAKPRQRLDLKALIAPHEQTAAQVYPPSYWLALPQPDERWTAAPGQSQGAPISVRMAGSYSWDELNKVPPGEYSRQPPPATRKASSGNLVVTMWDWGMPTSCVHTTSRAEYIDPDGNANGTHLRREHGRPPHHVGRSPSK
jgi:hypothetical protein